VGCSLVDERGDLEFIDRKEAHMEMCSSPTRLQGGSPKYRERCPSESFPFTSGYVEKEKGTACPIDWKCIPRVSCDPGLVDSSSTGCEALSRLSPISPAFSPLRCQCQRLRHACTSSKMGKRERRRKDGAWPIGDAQIVLHGAVAIAFNAIWICDE
jgi:hypothetical protein